MEGVLEGGGGVAVGKIHELKGHALLIGGYAEVGENDVDESGVSRAFGETAICTLSEGIV